MWTWSSAWAGACCGGAVSALPAEVPQCEDALAGATVGGGAALGRWDSDRRLDGPSPAETSGTATLIAAARIVRWGQLAVAVPYAASARSAGDLEDAGAGPGDVRIGARVDPWREHDRAVPVATVALRLPTGRDWTEASGPLLADVTGLPGVGGSAGLALQRSLGEAPWRVGLDASLDQGLPVALTASVALGRSLGPSWTVVGALAHREVLASDGAALTTVSGRIVRGEVRRWRGWIGGSSGLPAPLVGRDDALVLGLELGLVVAR